MFGCQWQRWSACPQSGAGRMQPLLLFYVYQWTHRISTGQSDSLSDWWIDTCSPCWLHVHVRDTRCWGQRTGVCDGQQPCFCLKFNTVHVQCESKKISHPLRPAVSGFFEKRLRILNQFFTHLLYVPIYARLQIFVQLSQTLTKLCHIKRNYLVHIICSKCPPSVEDNWTKSCRLA